MLKEVFFFYSLSCPNNFRKKKLVYKDRLTIIAQTYMQKKILICIKVKKNFTKG